MAKENKENISFEDTMKQLEQIVTELEKNDLDLDTSVTKFEKGMKLSKQCSQMLDDAEKRISILVSSEDGIVEKDFE